MNEEKIKNVIPKSDKHKKFGTETHKELFNINRVIDLTFSKYIEKQIKKDLNYE